MNTTLEILSTSLLVSLTTLKTDYAQQTTSRAEPGAIFPKGNRASDNNFAGIVWFSLLVPSDSTYTISVENVLFEPGARTYWHSYQAGQ